MINYRVDNLDELLAQLRASGVEIVDGPQSHETGSLPGLWTPKETNWNYGSRSCGTKRIRAAKAPASFLPAVLPETGRLPPQT